MSLQKNQSGFGHVGIILFVLAVAVIGFSAIEVLNANNKVALSSNAATTTSSQSVSVPSTITNKTSLTSAQRFKLTGPIRAKLRLAQQFYQCDALAPFDEVKC